MRVIATTSCVGWSRCASHGTSRERRWPLVVAEGKPETSAISWEFFLLNRKYKLILMHSYNAIDHEVRLWLICFLINIFWIFVISCSLQHVLLAPKEPQQR